MTSTRPCIQLYDGYPALVESAAQPHPTRRRNFYRHGPSRDFSVHKLVATNVSVDVLI